MWTVQVSGLHLSLWGTSAVDARFCWAYSVSVLHGKGNISSVIFRLSELQNVFVSFPVRMTSVWEREERDSVAAGSFPATANLLSLWEPDPRHLKY